MKLENGLAAFVTGGASGIGLGMAESFLAAGLKVAIADLDAGALEAAQARLGPDAAAVKLDVADPEAWPGALAAAEAQLGPIRLLCLNAGVGGGGGPVEEVPLAAYRRVFGVNLYGLLNGLAAWLPRAKREALPRHVVITASMSALRPSPGAAAYNISKFGALGLAETLRQELDGSPVGVSVLCPGMTDTAFMRNAVRAGQAPAGSEIENALAAGMSPRAVGEAVVKAVAAGEFYIFTHGDWREEVARRQARLLAAFGANADPAYREDTERLLAASAAKIASASPRDG